MGRNVTYTEGETLKEDRWIPVSGVIELTALCVMK